MKNRIIRFLAAFLFALPAIFPASAADNPAFVEPDFAFPQNVISDARKAISEADKAPAQTGPERLGALPELIAAEAAVDQTVCLHCRECLKVRLPLQGFARRTKL